MLETQSGTIDRFAIIRNGKDDGKDKLLQILIIFTSTQKENTLEEASLNAGTEPNYGQTNGSLKTSHKTKRQLKLFHFKCYFHIMLKVML